MRRLSLQSSIILLGFVFGQGCQKGPAVRFADAGQLIQHIQERTACSRGVVGDGRLEVKGPFVSYSGQLLYKAEAPHLLRFDLYSDFGVTLATLVSRKDSLTFLDQAQNTLVRGAPNACSLAHFTQVRVPPSALIELLRGRPPVLQHEPAQARLSWESNWFSPGRYLVVVQGDHSSEEKIWLAVPEEDWNLPLEQQRVRLSRVKVKQAGSTLYSVELDDYRIAHAASLEPTSEEKEMGVSAYQPSGPTCDAELPHRLSFDVGHAGHELSLVVAELSHNPPSWPESYSISPPAGVREVSANCP